MTATNDPLAVEARMPGGPFRRPGPGLVEVRIVNTAERPFVVNTRLSPGYRESSSREVFAEVFAPRSEKIAADHALLYDRHPATLADYVELPPGASLTGSFDLLDWYRISRPGAYELVVYYQADEPLAPDIAGLLRGVHASGRVPFVVEN